jgi:hypothetical protein
MPSTHSRGSRFKLFFFIKLSTFELRNCTIDGIRAVHNLFAFKLTNHFRSDRVLDGRASL